MVSNPSWTGIARSVNMRFIGVSLRTSTALLAVLRRIYPVTVFLQDAAQQVSNLTLVIHHQMAGGVRGAPKTSRIFLQERFG